MPAFRGPGPEEGDPAGGGEGEEGVLSTGSGENPGQAAEGRRQLTHALRRGCEVGPLWSVGTQAAGSDITESTVWSLLGYGTWNPTEDVCHSELLLSQSLH